MLFLLPVRSRAYQRSVYQNSTDSKYLTQKPLLRHRLVNCVGTVVGVLGMIAPAQAATINFTGTLTSLSDPGKVTGYDSDNLTNAAFTGTYTFDPTTPNTFYSTSLDNYNPSPANLTPEQYPSGRYVQPVENFTVKIGAVTIDLPTGEGTAFSRQLENRDTDSLTVSTLVKGATSTRDSYRVFFNLADSTGRSLSSVASDAELASLPQWDSSYFQLFRTGSACNQAALADCLFAEGVLTSFINGDRSESPPFTTGVTSELSLSLPDHKTSVPEPTSIAAMLGLGLLGLMQRLKRRSAT
jgi:PEP-CTERM motif